MHPILQLFPLNILHKHLSLSKNYVLINIQGVYVYIHVRSHELLRHCLLCFCLEVVFGDLIFLLCALLCVCVRVCAYELRFVWRGCQISSNLELELVIGCQTQVLKTEFGSSLRAIYTTKPSSQPICFSGRVSHCLELIKEAGQ